MNEEKTKLIFQSIAYAVLINEHTNYCVFIRFSGHVDNAEIEICESKEKYMNKICQTEIKTKFLEYYHKDENDVLAWIKAKRDVLKQILDENDIPYHLMDEEQEIITNYLF